MSDIQERSAPMKMNAKVVQFPRKKALRRDELPSHWPEEHRANYLHWTSSGYATHAGAFSYCEAMSRELPQQPGEDRLDWLLRMGRAELRAAIMASEE